MGSLLPLRRPGAPATSDVPRTLLEAIDELTAAIALLIAALGGSEAPAAPATVGPPNEAEIVAEATDLWDTPWESLSVCELRALLRDLPIDRSTLPAPIELLRRNELIEALNQLQSLEW
jgi:hypothetical protein